MNLIYCTWPVHNFQNDTHAAVHNYCNLNIQTAKYLCDYFSMHMMIKLYFTFFQNTSWSLENIILVTFHEPLPSFPIHFLKRCQQLFCIVCFLLFFNSLHQFFFIHIHIHFCFLKALHPLSYLECSSGQPLLYLLPLSQTPKSGTR